MNQRDLKTKKLNKLLSSLPRSGKKIAAFLKKKKIKGYISSRRQCPISNYIRKFLNINNVSTSSKQIEVNFNDDEIETILPYKISKFIRMFDENKFPFLIKK